MGWLGDMGRIIGVLDPASGAPAGQSGGPGPQAYTVRDLEGDLNDLLRGGTGLTGAVVTPKTAMRHAAVYRCVTLISNAMGMLPMGLVDREIAEGASSKAALHQLNDVLTSRPNGWQTPFVFKRLMQHRALLNGNAYAKIIRSRGRVIDLIPIDPVKVRVEQRDDLSVFYRYNRTKGGQLDIAADDMLHIMGPSDDGLTGMSLVSHAGETLGLSLAAQQAAARVFRNGVMAGGILTAKGKLSPEAIANIKEAMGQYTGIENSGKWIVGEEGLEAKPFSPAPRDAQQVEMLKHQIEEAARLFGVPRPFLMLDDTSWGSGIEQLAIYFVQYGLAPWFVCWEQAIERVCLTPAERALYQVKFNERALLRGSMKDQAEFFARALGAPGAKGWMTQDEVRDKSNLPLRGGDASSLAPPAREERKAA